MKKVSFTLICDNCQSKDVFFVADTELRVQMECRKCGAYGVEDVDLSVNEE